MCTLFSLPFPFTYRAPVKSAPVIVNGGDSCTHWFRKWWRVWCLIRCPWMFPTDDTLPNNPFIWLSCCRYPVCLSYGSDCAAYSSMVLFDVNITTINVGGFSGWWWTAVVHSCKNYVDKKWLTTLSCGFNLTLRQTFFQFLDLFEARFFSVITIVWAFVLTYMHAGRYRSHLRLCLLPDAFNHIYVQ